MRHTPILLLLAACGGQAGAPAEVSRQKSADEGGYENEEAFADAPAATAAPAPPKDVAKREAMSQVLGGAKMAARGEAAAAPGAPPPPPAEKPDEGGGEERLREWFPEAFLWQPLVETDAEGRARVPMRVPDQLTTWRVLGLAHSADGQQTGALASFDSRLDLWVDPAVPGWLFAGDRLDLPVQVASSRDEPWRGELRVGAEGALAGGAVAPVQLAARGTQVVRVPLTTRGAGRATLTATLPGADAAQRVIPVEPSGRPERQTRGGTLAAPRAWTMPSPSGADPSTQRLDVLVFPGPLSLVQAEVARVAVGTPDGAYGFALSSAAARLAGATGVEADANALRRLQIVSWQRVVRQLRSPDPVVAATLLSGLADVDGHLLAAEAKPRLVQVVQDHQRADGSWLIGDSGSLQRMLVQTAYVARALPADAKAPRARARGVVERHAKEIEDPYTAAVVLASGLADGATATALAKVVEKGLTTASDGARTVNTPSGVQNPWGARPSRAELLAWTILASPEASWRGDLVSELISGWDARWGFGAGSADVIALQAALAGLPPLGQEVEVVLSLDGVDVARARLDPKQPKVPALLEAAPSAKDPKIALRAEPPIPGLAWVATQRSWSAWRGDEGIPGVEVEARASRLVVGQDGAVILTVAAPSGASVRVVQGLPAGVSVDAARLSGQDGVVDAQARTDSVALRTRPFGAGEVMELRIPVRPSFAGRFATAPLEIEVEGRSVTVAPMIWEVSGG